MIRILGETMMKKLSFPDVKVEKMEFSPEKKLLNIFIESAWLEENGGTKLGKGILIFSDWESITISRFDPAIEKWLFVESIHPEKLGDLCEIKFFNSGVSLSGFGNNVGQWLEWRIVKTKMCAKFGCDDDEMASKTRIS